MLKNANILDKMLIFLITALCTLIKILQSLKRKNIAKYMQWLNKYCCILVCAYNAWKLSFKDFRFFG